MTHLIPSGWSLRDQQKFALDQISAGFASGKKIMALQGPTGSGKSLIGVASLMSAKRGYYLVPLKALQDQVETDFKNTLNIFKGKSNYICSQYTKQVYTAENSPCQGWEGGSERKKCRENKVCSYYIARDAAAEGKYALMNFSLYLCYMRLMKVNPEGSPFGIRDLHVIDEAHRVEDFIRDFLTIDTSLTNLVKYLPTCYPDLHQMSEKEEFVEFYTDLEKFNNAELEHLRKTYGENLAAVAMEIGSDKLEYHLSLAEKIKAVLKNPDNYVFSMDERYSRGQMTQYITTKPLKVGGFIRENVLGERTLFMSATLTLKSVLAMGFSEEEIGFIDLPSTFPAKNRLIKFDVVGKINHFTNDKMVPKIADKILNIVGKRPDVKGIIHAPSYRMMEQLEPYFKDSPISSRLLMQSKDAGAAKKILQAHKESAQPTVLFSPGMREGIDLRDELSRFQIIIKCPYPNLADPAIKALAELDYGWYVNRTIMDLLQMYGRSVRSAEDFAETIILDDSVRALLVKYKGWIPIYVRDAIRWV